MPGGSRLQVRPRGVAAITAWLFVLAGVLAMHHEASTGHARDAAGVLVHAEALIGHRTGHSADVHAPRDREAATGECALLTTFHQAASANVAVPAVVAVLPALGVPHAGRAAILTAAAEIYRLAPKTSPPVVRA